MMSGECYQIRVGSDVRFVPYGDLHILAYRKEGNGPKSVIKVLVMDSKPEIPEEGILQIPKNEARKIKDFDEQQDVTRVLREKYKTEEDIDFS